MKKKDSNRVLVSHTRKPFVFYLNLAERHIKQNNDIELTALGMAIPTIVTIAEALKRDGLASHREVKTSTVNLKEDDKGRFFQKAKIQIVLGKAEKSEKAVVANTAPKGWPEGQLDKSLITAVCCCINFFLSLTFVNGNIFEIRGSSCFSS